MRYIISILTLMFLTINCYSQLDFIDATVEYIEIDTNGFYSDISIKDKGRIIAVCGSYYSSPQCLALSDDFGESWKAIDIITEEENKNNLDFVDLELTYDNNVVVISNHNLISVYNKDLELMELKYINEKNQKFSYLFEYTTHTKYGNKFSIFQKEENSPSYNDLSSISIFDLNSMSMNTQELDMESFIKLLEPRDESYYRSKKFDDSQIVSNNCFLATTVMYVPVDGLPISYSAQKRCLVKINDIANPEWEVIPLLQTDSTAYHFIYFDDCENGFISTYKTYRKEYPRIYKTTDGGINWELIYQDDEEKYVLREFKRANDTTLFATSGLSNFYRSTDNGYSWSKIISDLKENTRGYEIIDENTLLVAYNKNSIAKLNINRYISSVDDTKVELFISPPYPQPARSAVTIEFGNYMLSKQDITIYNIEGREIKNQEITINYNTLIWDCSSAQPGIYLINIKHSSEEKAVKVVVE